MEALNPEGKRQSLRLDEDGALVVTGGGGGGGGGGLLQFIDVVSGDPVDATGEDLGDYTVLYTMDANLANVPNVLDEINTAIGSALMGPGTSLSTRLDEIISLLEQIRDNTAP